MTLGVDMPTGEGCCRGGSRAAPPPHRDMVGTSGHLPRHARARETHRALHGGQVRLIGV